MIAWPGALGSKRPPFFIRLLPLLSEQYLEERNISGDVDEISDLNINLSARRLTPLKGANHIE